ncbi:DedA family protein/thiosulfate sulfurtransferase GlpE [Dyella sp.]|jgi:membrane protein DedA with SNARE-associated domain/rhodanese-related sulfurtransferase|uniref:DedA family protein/thiosulfate sulfurtransferase GlpE n=1 Tax=Dyella sp. TaxID=1869338 RepID=UPI002D79876C|nr:DedA family protein/thiosulfate sulfurtransferase GlpE [Dyella sp.]HET6433351.1 DedA family protein/thiosulfate sulfurtransferase GlpE [Dyella sp.]
MAHDLITLIVHYGLLVVFLNVLIEQAGVPLPAVPTLIVAGALSASGQPPMGEVIAVAVAACLLSDLAWYLAGRRFGGGVMRTLCRISLSPDSCVKQSELRFQRWRGGMLVIAKFVPGLSTVAPPLVGAMGLRPAAFLLLDGFGSLLWVGAAVALGRAFTTQVDQVLAAIEQAGALALQLLLGLLALYIAIKWWQRHRLLVALRMARVTVDELNHDIAAGRQPVVVDVRSAASRLLDSRVIPGAVLADLDSVHRALAEVPRDRDLVIYCTCPNEVSAAKAARLLTSLGFRRVRPLLGGLDAWDAAGYTLDRLPPPQQGGAPRDAAA